MRRFFLIMLAGIALATPAAANPSPELSALETLIAESAETPAQHVALGRYYRSRAALARSGAEEQERMGRSPLYVHGNAGHQRFQRERRAEMAEALREQASAFEERAAAHETAARMAATEDGVGEGVEDATGDAATLNAAQ